MKTSYSLALLAVGALALAGCTSTTTTTTQPQVDQTQKRVHTEEELRKSGESQPGPALEKTDPAVRVSGPR